MVPDDGKICKIKIDWVEGSDNCYTVKIGRTKEFLSLNDALSYVVNEYKLTHNLAESETESSSDETEAPNDDSEDPDDDDDHFKVPNEVNPEDPEEDHSEDEARKKLNVTLC